MCIKSESIAFLAHRSRRLTRWGYSIARIRRPSSSSKLSNKTISKTSWSVSVKFYQQPLWEGGKAALGFGGRFYQNCGYHGNRKVPLKLNAKNAAPAFSQSPLIGSWLNLQVMRTGTKAGMSSKIGPDRIIHFRVIRLCARSSYLGWVELFTTELFALERSN